MVGNYTVIARKVYNPLSNFVRRLKDMQTKRSMYLILFSMALAWIVAQMQTISNPNNWQTFGSWKINDWTALSIAFILAILLAIWMYRLLAGIDKKLETRQASVPENNSKLIDETVAKTVDKTLRDLKLKT